MNDLKEEIISKLGISLKDVIIVYPENTTSKKDGFGIYSYNLFSSDAIMEFANILNDSEYRLKSINPQLLWLIPES